MNNDEVRRSKYGVMVHLPWLSARWYENTGCGSSEWVLATPWLNCGSGLTRGGTYACAFLAICTRMVSSCVCCLLSATCAAMTRCLSAISVHWAQLQSRHLQYRLCPFNHDTIPWMRQRAHLGMRGGFLSDMDCWIAKEVSAISFPDTLENLLKSISGCRDVHSTLSVVPLDATKLTDGKLLFKLFFYIRKFQEPLYTSVMIGPVSK